MAALTEKDFNKLVDGIMSFIVEFGGLPFYTYQYVFARSIVVSTLRRDAATITGLWSRQCLHGNTVILDRDGSACRIKDHPRAWNTGIDMTYRVVTYAGHSIIASFNHPFFTQRGWVQVGDLLLEDEVVVLKAWKSSTQDFIASFGAGWSNQETPAPEGEDGEQLVFVRLRSITPYKPVPVYDIEFPGKGWFIANGYKVHNTGKTTTVAITGVGLAVILPTLAHTYSHIEELQPFKEGFWVGIFAPISRQASLSYAKMRKILHSPRGQQVLNDELDIEVASSRGDSLELSHGSYVHAKTASPDSNIEGETYSLIIIDESQKVDRFKVEKEIEPMLSSTAGTLVKIGTAWLTRGGFHRDITDNIEEFKRGKPQHHFEFPYEIVIAEKLEQYKRDGNKFHLYYKDYIDNQIRKRGKNSLAFRMNFQLEWQDSNLDVFSAASLLDAQDTSRHLNQYIGTDLMRVAGIDVGKDNDPTVITINEVDFDNPIVLTDPVSGERNEFYLKKFVAFLELEGTFEDRDHKQGQYSRAVDFLREWDVVKSVIDATSIGDPVAERLQKLTPEIEWEFFKFTTPTKHKLYKTYIDEMESGRQRIAASGESKQTVFFLKWEEEHKSLEKHYTANNYMDCRAPKPESNSMKNIEGESDYHDDYPTSSALACWAARESVQSKVEVVDSGGAGAYPIYGNRSRFARYSGRRH